MAVVFEERTYVRPVPRTRSVPRERVSERVSEVAAPVRRTSARPVAKQGISFRAVALTAVALGGLYGLSYGAFSLAGSLFGERQRQEVVALQAELQRQHLTRQNLRAQVDQLGAPGRISAWAVQNDMVRADALALQPSKPAPKPILTAKSAEQPAKYASVGGVVGL